MYLETLESLGLTPNEAKIYRALIDIKQGSIGDISNYANIHRRNTYDAIRRLIAKGLAYQILPKKNLTFAPVHPDKLRELIDEKAKELNNALPGLTKKFEAVNAGQSVYIYKGIGGLKSYINLILQQGKDIYGIASKGTWFDPRIAKFIATAVKKLKDKKIKTKLIYDFEVENRPEVMKAISPCYKILPKQYSTGSSIDVFGDYVAIYSGMDIKSLDEEITIFILKDKTLALDFKKWFQFMWDHL